MKYINDDQVRGVVSFNDAVLSLRDVFSAHGNGEVENLIRTRAISSGSMISTMGAVLPYAGVMGVKVYSTINGKFDFYISLFSTLTGDFLTTIQANALTGFRTAAATIVAAQYLARPESKILAVFGSGVQARAHAEAFVEHTNVRTVMVVDARGDAADLIADLSARKGVRAMISDSQTALREADIVVTATRSKYPLFDGNQIKPGTFIAAIGSSKPDAREVDDEVLRRSACIAVEDLHQTLREAGEFVLAADGAFEPKNIVTLGQLASQGGQRRRSESDITLYKSVGVGLEDIALASLVWNRLKAI